MWLRWFSPWGLASPKSRYWGGCVFGGCVPEVRDQSVVRAVRPESSREPLACPLHVPVAPGFPWPAAAPFRLRVTISVVSSLLFLVRILAGCRTHLKPRAISSCNPELRHVCKDPLPQRGPVDRVRGAGCGRIVWRTHQPAHPSCPTWAALVDTPPSQSPRGVPGEASHTHCNVTHPTDRQCLCRSEHGNTPR